MLKPKEPTDKNSKLMQEMGAKPPYQWEPEPTDHIRYAMNLGHWASQVVAWVKWHTTRSSLSAWAMRDGRLLTIKHASVDLGWNYSTTLNRFLLVESEGLIRIEKDAKKAPGRIGLCAYVPKSRRRKSKLNSLCTKSMPPYLQEKIDSLSEIERKQFDLSYEAYSEWAKKGMKDVVAEWRALAEQVEDSIFRAFAMERKREVKRRVKATDARVELPAVPDFYTLYKVEIVQSQKPGMYNAKSRRI